MALRVQSDGEALTHDAGRQVEELERFARDPIVLADDVSPLDGFQFLTGFSRPPP